MRSVASACPALALVALCDNADGSGSSDRLRPMASSKLPLTLAELETFEITSGQGFRAMARFAMRYFDHGTETGRLRELISDVELEANGTTTDPAALSYWQACVAEVLAEDADATR
jgi:hypothetical protein